MNLNWLYKKNQKKLIIFFNGWGMDETVVKHLDPTDYDVLTINDYNTLLPLPDLSEYNQIHIISWSMGVMIATLYNCGQKTSTAINGTLFPIHTEYGINPKIYNLMEKGFNEDSCKKFITKMFDKLPENFVFPKRTIENQKAELTSLKQYQANTGYKYTRIIISDDDKIIPTKSQLNYWKDYELISSGHCPFYNYTKWEELI